MTATLSVSPQSYGSSLIKPTGPLLLRDHAYDSMVKRACSRTLRVHSDSRGYSDEMLPNPLKIRAGPPFTGY